MPFFTDSHRSDLEGYDYCGNDHFDDVPFQHKVIVPVHRWVYYTWASAYGTEVGGDYVANRLSVIL